MAFSDPYVRRGRLAESEELKNDGPILIAHLADEPLFEPGARCQPLSVGRGRDSLRLRLQESAEPDLHWVSEGYVSGHLFFRSIPARTSRRFALRLTQPSSPSVMAAYAAAFTSVKRLST